MKFSNKDVRLLNSKRGIKTILSQQDFNLEKSLRTIKYEKKLKKLQIELLKLQKWVEVQNLKVIIIFEGRDAAGKSGAIRRITQHLNPRSLKIVALPKPSTEELTQWYFQRYVNHFPKNGEILFLDRSWYNRAIVEPVNNFCTDEEYSVFINEVNNFENMLIKENTILIKVYFSISKEEQLKRFNNLKGHPLKQWKFSILDQKAQELWDTYTLYKNKMFDSTSVELAPWKVIMADNKNESRIEVIEYIIDKVRNHQM